MRIALVTPLIYDNPTAQSVVGGLAAAYKSLGHSVVAAGRYGPWLGNPRPERQRTSWGEVRRVGRGAQEPMEQARRARRPFAELCSGVDRIHLLMIGRFDPLLEECRAAGRGAPVLATFQDFGNPPIAPGEARRLDAFLSDCRGVSALSRASAEEIAAALPRTGGRATVIPNGCAPAGRGGVVKRPRPYVLCASRLLPYKGIDVLLMAWADLVRRGVRADLVLAGADYGDGHYRGLARALGLERRVEFLGEVGRRRLESLMRGCRAFALPSRREAFGMSALEAMSFGRPVVATRSGGPEDFISDGRTGLLVPPSNPRRLAEALERLLARPALGRRLGAAAAQAAKAYAWPRIAARYLALMR